VLLLGWSTFDLMLLYWVENGVNGLHAILKVLRVGGGARGVAGAFGRLGIAGLFTLHFGTFWSVHGLLVVTLFGSGRGNAFISLWEGPFGFFFGGWVIAGAAHLRSHRSASRRASAAHDAQHDRVSPQTGGAMGLQRQPRFVVSIRPMPGKGRWKAATRARCSAARRSSRWRVAMAWSGSSS